MKFKNIQRIVLLSGLLIFASCLKESESDQKESILYGHQQIPSINRYMPQALLNAFGDDNLFFGDNPPILIPIDSSYACYVTSSMWLDAIIINEGDPFVWQDYPLPYHFENQYKFTFSEQHLGIANLSFEESQTTSSTTSTYNILKDNLQSFTAESIAPNFFKNGFDDPEVFRYAYIMGNNPNFTVYYYEVRNNKPNAGKDFKPLNAAILSGKLGYETISIPIDTIEIQQDSIHYDSIVYNTSQKLSYITNVKWGVETMKYFNQSSDLNELNNLLDNGNLPRSSNIMMMHCDTLYLLPTSKNKGNYIIFDPDL